MVNAVRPGALLGALARHAQLLEGTHDDIVEVHRSLRSAEGLRFKR